MRTANKTWPLLLAVAVTASASASAWSWSSRPQPGPDRAGPTLTVATYNVNFGLAGDPQTLAAIGATAADVVLLQETTPAWEGAIRRALARRYPHMVFHHSRRWPAGGLAFLSRYPLRGLKRSRSPLGFFDAARLLVQTPLGTVQLLNVHLKPPVSSSGSYVKGYFVTPPERRAEMRAHLRLLDAGLPTLIAGDFNEARGGGLGVLARRRYVDALARLGPGTPTWRWPVGPLTLRQQLDHVVYDPTRLTCTGTQVLKLGRSDHLPVVARFQRPR